MNANGIYCLFSGIRASWLLLRIRILRFEYHSHVRRTTRSPDTDCGTYRERIAQTYPELLFDLTEFSSAVPKGETL